MWVSGSQDEWEEFKRPIISVLDANSGLTKVLRMALLVLLPIGLGGFAYNSLLPSFEEPIELRTVHPAPPATTKVHGKTYVCKRQSSPIGSIRRGNMIRPTPTPILWNSPWGRLMKDVNSPEDNPWDPNAKGYIKHVREGGEIFFQNCHFCHGDNLNGRGLWAFAFNPIPANFTDAGTIAQLQETFRVLESGKGRYWFAR